MCPWPVSQNRPSSIAFIKDLVAVLKEETNTPTTNIPATVPEMEWGPHHTLLCLLQVMPVIFMKISQYDTDTIISY